MSDVSANGGIGCVLEDEGMQGRVRYLEAEITRLREAAQPRLLVVDVDTLEEELISLPPGDAVDNHESSTVDMDGSGASSSGSNSSSNSSSSSNDTTGATARNRCSKKRARTSTGSEQPPLSNLAALVAERGTSERALKKVKTEKTAAENELEDIRCCVACQDAPRGVLLRPCSHMCLCTECADGLNECPICREPITERLKVIVS